MVLGEDNALIGTSEVTRKNHHSILIRAWSANLQDSENKLKEKCPPFTTSKYSYFEIMIPTTTCEVGKFSMIPLTNLMGGMSPLFRDIQSRDIQSRDILHYSYIFRAVYLEQGAALHEW